MYPPRPCEARLTLTLPPPPPSPRLVQIYFSRLYTGLSYTDLPQQVSQGARYSNSFCTLHFAGPIDRSLPYLSTHLTVRPLPQTQTSHADWL